MNGIKAELSLCNDVEEVEAVAKRYGKRKVLDAIEDMLDDGIGPGHGRGDLRHALLEYQRRASIKSIEDRMRAKSSGLSDAALDAAEEIRTSGKTLLTAPDDLTEKTLRLVEEHHRGTAAPTPPTPRTSGMKAFVDRVKSWFK